MGTDIEAFYGTALANSEHAKLDEAPMHVRFLEAYLIQQYPVTNAEYAVFVQETDHCSPPHWKNGAFAHEDANLPVVHVSWHDSQAYTAWAKKRLPTEAEWEKACRGPDGRMYPWGNIFVAEESESAETVPESSEILTAHLTPIGVRPAIVSPYGLGEAVGNVWEWTADWYQPYADTKRQKNGRNLADKHKTLRGGSWLEVRDGTAKRYFRCANRLHRAARLYRWKHRIPLRARSTARASCVSACANRTTCCVCEATKTGESAAPPKTDRAK